MDPTQVTRLLTWLDEEHRRDKTELQTLREKLAAQGPLLDSVTTRIRDLEAHQTALQSQTAKLAPLEEALSQARGQIAQAREQQARYAEEGDRTAQARKTEIDQLIRSRAALEQRVEAASREAAAPAARLQALTDDYKRVMAVFPQFEALRNQVNALAVRFPAFDADEKRTADRVGALERMAEDLRNSQVRIAEEHRLSTEEQKHLYQEGTAQVQSAQRRYDEQATALQRLVTDRSAIEQRFIGLESQLDTLRQAAQGSEGRLKRAEEQLSQEARGSLQLRDLLAQHEQELTRLGQLLTALERRLGDEVPSLRKLADELDAGQRVLRGQLDELSLEQQRDRDTLSELRRQAGDQSDRLHDTFTAMLQFQEQTLRHQVSALQQRIREAEKLAKPAVAEE